MRKTSLLFVLLLLSSVLVFAQQNMVQGVVKDALGDPLIGVTVLVQGTTQGTATDFDGKYELKNLPENAVLRFSQMGMKPQEIAVGNKSVIHVTLEEDTQLLDDVVVVGYGTAKAKDLTSPIANIKSDEINKLASSNAMQAIQGKIAGVQIVNTGEPGAGPSVRVRGVGSFGDESPLYVVDGMFYDNIDFLNPADIEDMSVLKDASAAAIYGVRAANGVVLVTTKKGSFAQDAKITYSGYVGVQTPTNMLKMANTSQYAQMLLEKDTDGTNSGILNKAAQLWGGKDGMPATNTNWYDELTRNAFMQNHSIDVTGGTEKAAYTVGLSYLKQDGILKYNSEYERFTLRTKGDYKPFNWLKIGTNVVIVKGDKLSGNNDAWLKAFTTPSIIPVHDYNNEAASDEKFASPMALGLNNGLMANPVAQAYYQNVNNEVWQILPSLYAEITFIPSKLTFRTSYSQDIRMDRYWAYTPAYYVSDNQKREKSFLEKADSFDFDYILDNILTYTDSHKKHNYSVMLGNSVRQENNRWLQASAEDVPAGKPEWGYINLGDGTTAKGKDSGSSYHGVSFFGRATYNYDHKYLLSLTMRADGSSKYNEKWGYFPSIGAGWVMSEEGFMKGQRVFDFLKLRASWGKLGNDKVAASAGFAGINNTTGAMGDQLLPGFTNQNTFSWLKWEVVDETNVGIEAAFLNNRLKLDADYYNRVTNNAVVACPLPITGEFVPGNYGKIQNQGVELSLNWADRVGKDFTYNVGFNLSTLKNEVKALKEGVSYLYTGSAEYRTIITPGEAINSYYGYKVTGVYQNEAQIKNDPIAVANNLVPGDLMYEDVNGDQVIDGADRQILGSALPKIMYGANLALGYKNFDFSMSMNGVAGNKIVNQKRGLRQKDGFLNYDVDLVNNRWHGEGTSDKYPSAAGMDKHWNVGNFSSFLIESGNYFRIQNMQLGYTFNHIGPKDKKGAVLRLYVSADRPFSHFNYNGFTPEVAGGFDTQTYPMASNYTFGVRLTY
ncbi:MAG: TonB-dependent receptor [Bacteroidales bacterium]